MKIKKHFAMSQVWIFVCLMSLTLLTSTALAQTKNPAAYAKGSAAALNDKQIARLLALRIPVAIPTYIPNGFQIEKITLEREKYATGYSLFYKNSRGATFTIQSTDEGIGSVGTERTITGKNPYFTNDLAIGYQEEDKNAIWGEWVENRRQASGFKKNQYYSLLAEKISLQEAMKIMKSLRYLEK